jgi:ADP-ribosyl-[dinitrogen reductase] hydrolase
MPTNRKTIEHYTGCLIGGAVGDALGAPVELMSLSEITSEFGPDGISDYAEVYGRKGAITDDTQMTLFTAEGLILSKVRSDKFSPENVSTFVYHAYLRWLSTQSEVKQNQLIGQYGTCSILDGVLTGYPELHSRRAPGSSCISALMSNEMGFIEDPINDSKGCGGVMRIAPVALFLEPEQVFDVACKVAAITHGHPTGYLAAGCLAQIISFIISGDDLIGAIEKTVSIIKIKEHHEECFDAIDSALKAEKDAPISFETVETLGQGWIAEEALAIAIYCSLVAGNDFEKGVRLAVNHSGDSDSTGSITGNILGAVLGIDSIPGKYLEELELIGLIKEVAVDLFERV